VLSCEAPFGNDPAVAHRDRNGRAGGRRVAGMLGLQQWGTGSVRLDGEKRGGALRAAIPDLPLDRLHLETDAPYLGPKNANKRRPYNEPANLIWVARAVAELKGISEEEVAQACTGNSRRLFGQRSTAT